MSAMPPAPSMTAVPEQALNLDGAAMYLVLRGALTGKCMTVLRIFDPLNEALHANVRDRTSAGLDAVAQPRPEPVARLLAVVPYGQLSPLSRDVEVTCEAVMHHMARRLAFANPAFHLEVFTDSELQVSGITVLSEGCHHGSCTTMFNPLPKASWSALREASALA